MSGLTMLRTLNSISLSQMTKIKNSQLSRMLFKSQRRTRLFKLGSLGQRNTQMTANSHGSRLYKALAPSAALMTTLWMRLTLSFLRFSIRHSSASYGHLLESSTRTIPRRFASSNNQTLPQPSLKRLSLWVLAPTWMQQRISVCHKLRIAWDSLS